MIALAPMEEAPDLAERVTRSFATERGGPAPRWGVMCPADGAGRIA
jgi:hypothetical protein